MPDKKPERVKRNLFQPGKSGNPAGRPKGARNKLGEQFLKALEKDFKSHGAEVIEAVRHEKPDVYLKVVAQIVPKQMTHTVSKGLEGLLRDLSDKRRIIDITPEVEIVPNPVRSGGVRDGGERDARALPGRSIDALGGEARLIREVPDREDD